MSDPNWKNYEHILIDIRKSIRDIKNGVRNDSEASYEYFSGKLARLEKDMHMVMYIQKYILHQIDPALFPDPDKN
tara:strand:- start:255 stop:479 length:225 start_codon:yes stop_codon:yes gene_type:complete